MILSLLGCADDEPSVSTQETSSDTPNPSTAPEATPPPLQYFDERTAALSEIDGACPVLNFDQLLDQFTAAKAVDYTSTPYLDEPDTTWTGTCTVFFTPESGTELDLAYAVVNAFDTNVDAFEHYQDSAKTAAETFSNGPIDAEHQLPETSPWHDSRITAQETPTVQSAQRSTAAVALLGDFYTVEILVRFEPGQVAKAGCGSGNAEECAMTATEVAEFFATSGYLDELHADIEAAIDDGM